MLAWRRAGFVPGPHDDAGQALAWSIVNDIDGLEAIRAEWETLWTRACGSYYLSFDYVLRSWELVHRPAGAALCCAVARRGAALVGVLPMVVQQRRLGRTALPCGPMAADDSDLLIEPTSGAEDAAAALLQAFLRLVPTDFLEFPYVKAGSALESAIRRTRSLLIVASEQHAVPYADMKAETDWDTYERTLDISYQRKIARERRRLEKRGTVSLDVVSGQATPTIDWLLEQKRNWAIHSGNHGPWVLSTPYRALLNALVVSDPRFLVFALRLDGATIAAALVGLTAASANGIIAAFDGAYRRYSPGLVLQDAVVRHLFSSFRGADGRHLDKDFGVGLEPFKLHWSRGNVIPATSYRIAASRRAWTLFHGAQTLRRLHRLPAGLLRCVGIVRASSRQASTALRPRPTQSP